MIVTSLERVDNAQNLGGVTASAGRIGEDGADGLLGVDDEDGADGESNALGVNVGGILVVNPGIVVSLSSCCPLLTEANSTLTCRRQERPSSPCRQ